MKPISIDEGHRTQAVDKNVELPRIKMEEIDRLKAQLRKELEDFNSMSERRFTELDLQRAAAEAEHQSAIDAKIAFIAARPGWNEAVFAAALKVVDLADGAAAQRRRAELSDNDPSLPVDDRFRREAAKLSRSIGIVAAQRVSAAAAARLRETEDLTVMEAFAQAEAEEQASSGGRIVYTYDSTTGRRGGIEKA